MDVRLTFNYLPAIAVIISILAWYVPKFKTWYQGLEPENKQLFMLGILALVTIATTLLSYFGFLKVYTGATWQEWVWYPIVDFGIAVVANAGTYKATNRIFGRKTKG